MSRTVIVAQYRRGGSVTMLERIMDCFNGNHFRVTQTDEYRSVDKAKDAYMERIPASAQVEQKKNIKDGLRFSDERAGADGGNNVNTKAGTGKRKRGASAS